MSPNEHWRPFNSAVEYTGVESIYEWQGEVNCRAVFFFKPGNLYGSILTQGILLVCEQTDPNWFWRITHNQDEGITFRSSDWTC